MNDQTVKEDMGAVEQPMAPKQEIPEWLKRKQEKEKSEAITFTQGEAEVGPA